MNGVSENLRLLIRAGSHNCALRLADVVETLRPLPIEPLSGAPKSVRGLACIRGTATPVVDLAALLEGGGSKTWARFVCVRAGNRTVALVVDEVLGIREFPTSALSVMPPLLRSAQPQMIDAIAALDADLYLVLKAAGLVPTAVLPAT